MKKQFESFMTFNIENTNIMLNELRCLNLAIVYVVYNNVLRITIYKLSNGSYSHFNKNSGGTCIINKQVWDW